MCGLAGIVSGGGGDKSKQVRAATDVLKHRGPEAEGFWANEKDTVSFGHRRLSIIDLSCRAAQPMHYQGRYTIIYNGEIYNYLEIKKDLEKAGYIFSSLSDTEVILAAYACWGKQCVQKFDGAFSFAIWDERDQQLFAARDRFGEKPFFYSYDGERFCFASEIKALWQMELQKEVNRSLLYNFFTLGYTSNPANAEETFFNNINKLPAAHSIIYSLPQNKLYTEKYWGLYPATDNRITEKTAIEKFTLLMEKSIHTKMRSDVTIGTSLSGGLDSSSIVAFCEKETAANYTHKCFTASFPGFKNDETNYAGQVADYFSLKHFTTTIAEAEVSSLLDGVAKQQDEPFSSASVLAQYKVFELAKREGVTVLLDGQGADEMLGGYHKYYKWYWQELYRAKKLGSSGELKAAQALGIKEKFGVKTKAAALVPEFSASYLQAAKSRKAFRHPDLNRGFAFENKRNSYYALPTTFDLAGALYYNTFTNGLEELLRLADRNSMAHSVEVRLPFLQHELVEFLFSLPSHFKIYQGWTKWLLRKTVAGRLPGEIVWRREKVGYEPPQKEWMKTRAVQERILEARKILVENEILNAGVVAAPVIPKNTHEEGSLDWRYWSAAQLF